MQITLTHVIRLFLYSLPYCVLVGVGAKIIVPCAGKMRIPVAIYMLVIFFMAFSAVCMAQIAPFRSAVYAMAGAWIFMLSDTLNGYNKFVKEVPIERPLTMSTYILGQFLIVESILLF